LSKLQDSTGKLGDLGSVWLHGLENTVVVVHLGIERIVSQLQHQACEELKQVRVGGQVLGLFYTTPDDGDPLTCGKPVEAVYSGQDVFFKIFGWKLLVECPRAEVG
jgi:hypothetical protein